MRRRVVFISSIAVVSCAGSDSLHPAHLEHAAATPSPEPAQSTASANAKTSSEPKPSEPKRDLLLEWVRSKLPPGGKADRDEQGTLVVTHQAGPKDTIYSVAKAYVDLTSVYLWKDLASLI
ncbi:MAG TPA: hypothetical protein VLM85_06000, partial [Polyangiaceae bacterium]|nr:hypothetical protein [Polyangiaceae bacterium]